MLALQEAGAQDPHAAAEFAAGAAGSHGDVVQGSVDTSPVQQQRQPTAQEVAETQEEEEEMQQQNEGLMPNQQQQQQPANGSMQSPQTQQRQQEQQQQHWNQAVVGQQQGGGTPSIADVAAAAAGAAAEGEEMERLASLGAGEGAADVGDHNGADADAGMGVDGDGPSGEEHENENESDKQLGCTDDDPSCSHRGSQQQQGHNQQQLGQGQELSQSQEQAWPGHVGYSSTFPQQKPLQPKSLLGSSGSPARTHSQPMGAVDLNKQQLLPLNQHVHQPDPYCFHGTSQG